MLHPQVPDRRKRADPHTVQGRRNRPDGVLRQRGAEKAIKLVRAADRPAEHAVDLLHRGQKDLIELGKLLGFLRSARLCKLGCPGIERLCKSDRLQKTRQGFDLFRGIGSRQQLAAQRSQRNDCQRSAAIQFGELRLNRGSVRLLVFLQTVGIPVKGLLPARPAEVPDKAVVFKPVRLIRGDRRIAGFQILRDALGVHAAGRSLECVQDGADNRMPEQRSGSGEICRNVIGRQQIFDHRRKNGLIGVGNCQIAVPRAGENLPLQPPEGRSALLG